MKAGLVGPVQQAQVPELVPGGPADLQGLLIQDLRRDLIAAKLVKEIQQLLQKGGLLGGTAIDRQLRGRLQQRFLQRQQLAAGVQRHLGRAAGDSQHPLCQTAETQHFRVAAGSGTADPAQVHLRLVRGVLRHQQDLPAAVSQLLDAVKDGI